MLAPPRQLSAPPGTATPRVLALLLSALFIVGVSAQDRPQGRPDTGGQASRQPDAPRPPTAADYARAERFLAPAVTPLVIGGSVVPNWLSGDRFWYRNQVRDGYEFILVTPATRTRKPAFDHAKLAAALSQATRSSYAAHTLPFQSIELSADGTKVSFDANGRRWTCDVQGTKCADVGAAVAKEPGREGAGS